MAALEGVKQASLHLLLLKHARTTVVTTTFPPLSHHYFQFPRQRVVCETNARGMETYIRAPIYMICTIKDARY